MINHRYTVLQRVGTGGTAEVFLVEDRLRGGRHVAMKILNTTHQLAKETEEAFHNEVKALATLSHPNLVNMLDISTVHSSDDRTLRGRRFFTMEFVRGTEFLDWMAPIVDEQENTAMLVGVLLQSLSVLSYVHREGFVHCDIKPQNLVLVGERGSLPLVKLMDFGFATKAGRCVEGSARGTLEYTPPEILQGKCVDRRSDLYSLGVTFYHVMEGHCPFEAREPIELTKRILAGDPAFSRKSTGDRAIVQDIVARLIRKDPDERFAIAEQAANAIAHRIPNGRERFDASFGTSIKSTFVGRNLELKAIEERLAFLGQRETPFANSCVWVKGSEGIGKSRLIIEAKRVAHTHGVQVYQIETRTRDIPFGGIASFVEMLACDVRSRSESGARVYEKYNRLLQLESDIDHRLNHWANYRDNTREIIARFVVECANEFCFVALSDSTSMFDAETVQLIETIGREGESGRFLLLLEDSEDGRKSNARYGDEIRLPELTLSEIEALCVSSLNDKKLGEALSPRLLAIYGGTPGILVEVLNAIRLLLMDAPLLDEDGYTEFLNALDAKLPRNVDDMLMARFHKVNPERQVILNMVSCFRYPVKQDLLQQLLPFSRERLANHVRSLQLDNLIALSGSEQMLVIRIEKLKEAILELMGPERKEIHGAIASALGASIDTQNIDVLHELAHQCAASESFDKALVYYELGADKAKKLHATQRSVQLYESAVTIAREVHDTGRERSVGVKLSEALFELGAYRRALDLAEELGAATLPQHELRATAMKVCGLSYARLGEHAEARECLHAALDMETDENNRLVLRQELVGLQISAGDFVGAEKESRDQLAQADISAANPHVGVIYTNLGIATFFQNRFDDAVHWFGQAMVTYEAFNDHLQITNAMNNIAIVLSARGDYHKAILYWQKALVACNESGTSNQQAQILNNLGIAHYHLKMHDAAKEYYREARDRYARIGSNIGIAFTLGNLGELLLAECEYEAALKLFREAKSMHESMGNNNAIVEMHLHIASVLFILGDSTQMETELERAHTVIVERNQQMYSARYHELVGRLKYKKGELSEAAVLLTTAVELFKADGAKEPLWLVQLRLAECIAVQGDIPAALRVINDVAGTPEAMKLPKIVAEVNYLLGTIAARKDSGLEKPILYLKRGIDALTKEPVCETTWKITYAIAQEYYARGQYDRSKQFLLQTDAVLQFVMSHFASQQLKQQYMRSDNRESVLATIASLISQ